MLVDIQICKYWNEGIHRLGLVFCYLKAFSLILGSNKLNR
jgi:HKD family nuclease